MTARNGRLPQDLLQTLGYWPTSRPPKAALGFEQVDFWLPPPDMESQESLTFRLITPLGNTSETHLRRALPSGAPTIVCPGKVDWQDAYGRPTYFFVFGGQLTSQKAGFGSLLTLRSPAPILMLDDRRSTATEAIVSSTLARFAELRAQRHWGQEELLLAATQKGPLPLYLSVIQTLLNRYEQSPALRNLEAEVYRLLKHERQWLMDNHQWPLDIPEISGLLK